MDAHDRIPLAEFMRKERIPLAISYHETRAGSSKFVPFDVRCGDGDIYDFDWCHRDGVSYYHCIGFGPFKEYGVSRSVREDGLLNPIWIADWLPIRFPKKGPKTFASCGYRRIEHPLVADPFLAAVEVETGTIYCSRCDDNLPKDDEDPCDHVWWCERMGWWRGATGEKGLGQPCRSEQCAGCSYTRERRARARLAAQRPVGKD